MTKKTNKEFLNEVCELVGNEYTFKEDYKNAKTKIAIKHNKCGYEYFVAPSNFLSGNRFHYVQEILKQMKCLKKRCMIWLKKNMI